MVEQKRWVKLLKKLWCWLTGGHTYADINLRTHHIPEKKVTCFVQTCLKCGKVQVYAVKDEALFFGTPLEGYEVKFYGN